MSGSLVDVDERCVKALAGIERQRRLVVLVRERLPYSVIAQRLGVSRATVIRWAAELGIAAPAAKAAK